MKHQLEWLLARHPLAVSTFEELSERDPRASKFVNVMARIRNNAIAEKRCFLDCGFAKYPIRNDAVEQMQATWNYLQDGDDGEVAMIHFVLVFLECGRRGLLDCPCVRCVEDGRRLSSMSLDRQKSVQKTAAASKQSARRNTVRKRR